MLMGLHFLNGVIMNNKILLLVFFLFFSCSIRKEKTSYNGKYEYWTDDLNEIQLVMSYVIEYNDYQKMYKLESKEKIKFLDNYWNDLDPDKSTSENELLEELKTRVLECKQLFSGIDGELLSDRAKIYIIYGPPTDEYKKTSYNNNSEVLIWKYKTGYEFKFIIDTFGRYKLIN